MKTRILSAFLIAVIFIPFLYIGGIPFRVLFTILGVCGLHELIHIKDKKNKIPSIMKIVSYLAVTILCLNNTMLFSSNYIISYQMIAVMIFVFILPIIFINDNNRYSLMDAIYLVSCVLFIGLSFNLLNIVRNYDLTYILYLLLITIMTDTFALVAGKLVGKHKLCPEISPNKTVEGLIGGTLMGVISATCFYTTVINATLPLVILILITTLLSLVGQLGDLVFSSIKRYYGKKDFSDLIPGHGGVLDRFDSLIFVALATILFLVIL